MRHDLVHLLVGRIKIEPGERNIKLLDHRLELMAVNISRLIEVEELKLLAHHLPLGIGELVHQIHPGPDFDLFDHLLDALPAEDGCCKLGAEVLPVALLGFVCDLPDPFLWDPLQPRPRCLPGLPIKPLVEGVVTGLLDREPEILQTAAWEALPFDGWLITGVPRFDAQKRLFNSAVLMRADGTIEVIYDKRRLVPFGEFVPFRGILPFVDAIAGPVDFSAGTGEQLIKMPHFGLIQVLICYETLFPGVAGGPGPRPEMLVNLTNDAWFGDTPGPWQHLEQVRMRAVEEGIPMIRVANTGVTAAFGPSGRVLGRIGLGGTGFIDVAVPASLPPTAYAGWREWPFMALLLLLALFNIRLDRKQSIRHLKP